MKKAVVIIICLATLLLLTLCKQKQNHDSQVQTSPYLNHHDSVEYVGTEKCAQCHLDKVSTFLETGMGESFNVASLEKTSGRFKNFNAVYDTFSDLYYYPYWTLNTFYLMEFRLKGRDTIHKRIEKISYIIGSGHHTNSHFTEENGFLFQAPLTFYTQKEQWDLPPGFENGHNTRFSRKIGMECISCHNSLPITDTKSDNRYLQLPHGISCERCHGPGALHVQEKLKGKMVDVSKGIDYTIVNPKKLSWQRQIDICQRCHLQGNAVLKPGKTFADFRPGMALSETFDQFSPEYEGDADKMIMAAHAERFQKSKCFLSSVKGSIENENAQIGFTCISCHNPHISVRKTNTQKFNSTCKSCHGDNEQIKCSENKKSLDLAMNNCVKCHMPAIGTKDIPHVSVHDHYIRKPQDKSSRIYELKIKGLKCITNKHPDKNTIAEAYISYYEKFDNNPIYLQKAKETTAQLSAENKNEIQTIIHLYYMNKNYAEIINLAKSATAHFNDAWSNYRVAKAYENTGELSKAKQWMNACLNIQPENLDFILQYGIMLIRNNEYAHARENFEHLNKLYSKNAESWAYLGIIQLKKNEFRLAGEYLNKALQLDPDLRLALENLKLLYQATGNTFEKEKIEKRLTELREKT